MNQTDEKTTKSFEDEYNEIKKHLLVARALLSVYESRAASIAKTNVEQALMWVNCMAGKPVF